jgi:hypothetical protein
VNHEILPPAASWQWGGMDAACFRKKYKHGRLYFFFSTAASYGWRRTPPYEPFMKGL